MAQTIISIFDDADFDSEHDEYQTFVVAECDADTGEPVGGSSRFTSEREAATYAHRIAHGREVHWD